VSNWVFLKLSRTYDVLWPNPVYSFNPAAACFYLLMRRRNNNICRLNNGGVGAGPDVIDIGPCDGGGLEVISSTGLCNIDACWSPFKLNNLW
jgi:hypothetical protein